MPERLKNGNSVLQPDDLLDTVWGRKGLLRLRHSGKTKANAVFVDGHAESLVKKIVGNRDNIVWHPKRAKDFIPSF